MLVPRMAKYWRVPLYEGPISEWTEDQVIRSAAAAQLMSEEEIAMHEKARKEAEERAKNKPGGTGNPASSRPLIRQHVGPDAGAGANWGSIERK